MSPHRTSHLATTRAAAALACALVALAGCNNPFMPAKAQPPVTDTGQIVVQTDYTTTEGTLATIAEAIGVKGQGNGQAAYIGAFADTSVDEFGFTAVFDPSVVVDRTQAGKKIPTWTRPLEADFYRYLFTVGSPITETEYSLKWTPEGIDAVDDGAGVATIDRQYDIKGTNNDGSGFQVAWGHATITMRRTSTTLRWVITHWEDHVDAAYGPDPTDPDKVGFKSFSRLRIDSYNR